MVQARAGGLPTQTQGAVKTEAGEMGGSGVYSEGGANGTF